MELRAPTRTCIRALLASTTRSTIQTRPLHNHIAPPPVPAPTPFVPDPATFLTLIGRNLSQHAAKFPSWTALFSLSGPQLRELGIEPARDRRYLLRWREKFRNGEFGIGGDLRGVKEGGIGEVKVVDVELAEGKTRRTVVEAATTTTGDDEAVGRAPRGMKVATRGIVVGRGVRHVKGSRGRVATVRVEEGLWEVRRGHKVDGGERRKAEVRAKRKGEERAKR